MLNLETYGMIIYGGVTTILFLIISVLAYKRLNDEHTNTIMHVPKSPSSVKTKRNKNDTLFPFYSRITPNMTMDQIQQIGAQSYQHRNLMNFKTDESITETSIIFNTNFWSKYPNKVIPNILNEMNEFEFENNSNDDGATNPFLNGIQRESTATIDIDDNLLFLSQNQNRGYPSDDDVVLNIIGSRCSLSNTYSHLNITPQMIHPKLGNDHSSHVYHKTLSDPDCIKHIHLQRQRSRHSLSHLAVAKRTCLRVTIEYFKEMLRNRSIYSPSLQHAWDVATDISVLLKWGKHAFQGTDMDHIDFVPLFWTSLLVQVGYRLVSGYAIFKSERSIKKAMLQICDLLMVREIYISHIECRITDTLVYIKKLEAVLEAAPQLILTTYFFLRVGTLEHSYTEIIGWLWSFFTLSTKVINDDTKMYKHIKSRWNRQFIYRCLFRLFEICSRVMVIGLVATAVSARAAMAVITLDLVFLLFSYYYGLLSNDKMNILGSLITFVDLTIYPKVSPLYSWYVSISVNQKRMNHKYNHSLQQKSKHISWTSSTLNKLFSSTPFNHDDDQSKSRGKFGKLFDFNIFNKSNPNDASGSTSITANSNHCSLENSVEHHFTSNKRFSDLKVNINMETLTTHDSFQILSEEQVKKSPMISEIFESNVPQNVHYAQVAQQQQQQQQHNRRKVVEEEKTIAPSKLNLSITVPQDQNATIYVKTRSLHEGQLSIRERSSYLLKQMTNIEVVYLELQQEETLNKQYTEYRCCGCCCCWFKCCNGCLPQHMVEILVNKCYFIVLCLSWVWCTYCCSLICATCKCCKKKKKKKHMQKQDENMDKTEDGPITKQLTLAIKSGTVNASVSGSDGDIDTEQEPDLEMSTSNIPEPEKRVSFSDRFKQLKRKKVRFADVLLKDRTKKKKKDTKKMNCKPNEEPSMSDSIPPQLTLDVVQPNSNTITDSKSVLQMVDFAQQKSCDVTQESSSEEAPQDWWESKQGTTKFAVATLRSLHGMDGDFPDLPGLTPVNEYKADKVYPVNSFKNLAIDEGSEEASFPWQNPEKSDPPETETFDLLDVITKDKDMESTQQHKSTITPFSLPEETPANSSDITCTSSCNESKHESDSSVDDNAQQKAPFNNAMNLKVNISMIEYVTHPATQQSDESMSSIAAFHASHSSEEETDSDYVAMRIMAQILEYAGIQISFESSSSESLSDNDSSLTTQQQTKTQIESDASSEAEDIPKSIQSANMTMTPSTDNHCNASSDTCESTYDDEQSEAECNKLQHKIPILPHEIGGILIEHSISDSDESFITESELEKGNSESQQNDAIINALRTNIIDIQQQDKRKSLTLDDFLGNLPRNMIVKPSYESSIMDTDSVDLSDTISKPYEDEDHSENKPLNLDYYLGNLPRNTIIAPIDAHDTDTSSISMDTDSVGSSSNTAMNVVMMHTEHESITHDTDECMDPTIGNNPVHYAENHESKQELNLNEFLGNLTSEDTIAHNTDTNSVGSYSDHSCSQQSYPSEYNPFSHHTTESSSATDVLHPMNGTENNKITESIMTLDEFLGNLPRDTIIASMDEYDELSISMDTNSVGSSSCQTTKTLASPQHIGNIENIENELESTEHKSPTPSFEQDASESNHSSTDHKNAAESKEESTEIIQNNKDHTPQPLDLSEILGNIPRNTTQDNDPRNESTISMIIESEDASDTEITDTDSKERINVDKKSCSTEHQDTDPQTASSHNDETPTGLATLLGIENTSNSDELNLSDTYHPVRNVLIQKSFEDKQYPVRNMAIAKSFEMFVSEQDKSKQSNSATPKSRMTYTISADSNRGKKSPTMLTDSGNTTPFVPNDAYTNALLQLAGLQNEDADRLKRLFTNRSALNTPIIKSECSTAATSPMLTAMGGFPDIGDDSMPLSRGLSLRDKSMTIAEQPTLEESEEKHDHLSVKMDAVNSISPSISALTLEKSPSTEFNVEVMNKKEELARIQVNVANISSGDIYASPYFTINTPQAKKKDIKPFCGLQKFVFDRGIVHRYAFLVILSRTLQSLLLVPFIAYIVYMNPVIFGGKDDIASSNEYWIRCYPWCTSQSLRHQLSQSLVFMQFVIACSLTSMLAIIFFLLSSPYLLFATSITRSPLSLLKTGCIYDSIQYFSKKAKCTPSQILCDFNFMQMFFDELIKRRIPVFYCESDDADRNPYDHANRLHHKILKNADSEILLTSLQLNISAQLAERVAIKTIKEGYLHLLQFIMACTSMDKENKLMFDPSNCVDEDGNALLHVAVIRSDEHIIQYVLDRLGYDPRKNMSNQDVIDLLILHGDIQILQLMLSFFKSANRLDLTKKTLFKSIKRGNMEFVTCLMEVEKKQYHAALWIKTYIDRDKSMHHNHNDAKESLLQSGSFLTGRTLLMFTSMNGHATTTQWLLNDIKVDATKQDKEGKTALMHAIINQNVNVVNVFIKDPNIKYYINAKCNKGITALLYATMEGSLDCVRTLTLKKKWLDPNICGGIHEETALIHASRYGHQEIALQLIKAKKIKVNIQNKDGKTALMFAAGNGLTKIVKDLLASDDIDVEIKDNEEKTTLDYVEENISMSKHYEIIKKAIKAHIKSKSQAQNVDPERKKQKRRSFIMIGELAALQTSNKIKRRYSKTHRSGSRKSIHHNHNHSKESTPISAIKRKRNKSRSKSVLSLKLDLAEAPPPLVDVPIDDVEFYLWYAIQMDYDNVCHWFLQNTRCGRDLVGREDLEMIDVALVGKNPFHFAVKTGSDKCLRILLEIDGMDKTQTFVNEKDNEGFTPLIYAVIDGKMTIVELLLKYHETEVNAPDDDDHRTPLMHAAMRGYANIVQLLLNHRQMNIDGINHADKKGQTALCLAVRHNRARVVLLLMDHSDIEMDKARTGGRTPLMYAVKNGLLNIVDMLLSTNKVEINKKVESQLQHCKDDKIAKEIASRLTFYKIAKERYKTKQKQHKYGNDLQLLALNSFTAKHQSDDDDDDDNDNKSVIIKEEEKDGDEFYRLASKEVEIKRVHNDWNSDSMNMEIEDKLFNKWLTQLEILHICAERHDDTVFKELWDHWIGAESIDTAIKVQTHYRAQTSSSTMNLYDILSQEWLINQVNDLLPEKDHFQNLKWYYFLVMISNKGWHRLFIRFIQEIEHRKININWKFIPNDPREIDLMAKHGHIDELEEYLTRMRKANDSSYNLNDAMYSKEQSCCYFSNYSSETHMCLMLESIFENFGQSAANKPKLGQCLRFVLAKTMSQYLFNSKLCD